MKGAFSILLKREIYLMLLIYIFILFPLALCILYIGIWLDRHFGFPELIIINNLVNGPLAVFLVLSGALIIWRAYTYLVIIGEGSPAQMLGQTKRLVTEGPYSAVRHPSFIGKFLIMFGMGVFFRSFSFISIIIPLLFCYAFIERIREEKRLMMLWPGEYARYRENTPFILPKIKSLPLLFKGE